MCLRGERDQNPFWVVFFRRVFTCPEKFVAGVIESLFPPPFAISQKCQEITQKSFWTEWVFRETEFFGPEGLIFRYVTSINITFSTCNCFWVLECTPRCKLKRFQLGRSGWFFYASLEDQKLRKKHRRQKTLFNLSAILPGQKMHGLFLMTIKK